jgi:hypothetical protein
MTQEELQAKIARFKCCASNLSYKLLRAQQLGNSDTNCLYCRLQLLLHGIEVLERYNPPQGADYSDDYSEDYNI